MSSNRQNDVLSKFSAFQPGIRCRSDSGCRKDDTYAYVLVVAVQNPIAILGQWALLYLADGNVRCPQIRLPVTEGSTEEREKKRIKRWTGQRGKRGDRQSANDKQSNAITGEPSEIGQLRRWQNDQGRISIPIGVQEAHEKRTILRNRRSGSTNQKRPVRRFLDLA